MNTKNYINKFIFFFTIYVFLILLNDLLIPFQDQPDFIVRVERLKNEPKVFFSIYSYINFFNYDQFIQTCDINYNNQTIWFKLNSNCIYENILYYVSRLCHTLTLTIPIFFIIANLKKVENIYSKYFNNSKRNFKKIANSLILCLISPSFIYFVSLVSEEVFTVFVMIFLFLVSESIILSCFILLLVLGLDQGSFIVGLIFYVNIIIINNLPRKLNNKMPKIYFILLSAITYIFSFDLFKILNFLEINKIYEISNGFIIADVADKYPLLLRPIITYMSLIFMTSSGLKSVATYFYFPIFLFILIKYNSITDNTTVLNSNQPPKRVISEFYASITTMVSVVFVLPDHSYAKYYIFMLPFLFNYLLYYLSFVQAIILILSSTALLYINIISYYI